jgi:pimeloyl-ACP methyl ester carboxylesterase
LNLFLIPGFMATKSLWDDVITDFEKVDPITQRAMIDAPEIFALVEFSMGGYIAREIARIAPGRVKALVLIATSARADTPGQIVRKTKALEQVRLSGFGGLSRATIAQSFRLENARDAVMVDRVRQMSLDLGKDVFIRQTSQERKSDLERLDQILCPTLVIAATEDGLRSFKEAEELQAGIPDTELVIVQGSGHMLPIETPHALSGIVVPWLLSSSVT